MTQITKSTLKIIQDLDGLDPNISVSLAARWIAYKQTYANKILKRTATADEVIQVYKGLLNDTSEKAKTSMENFRKHYGEIKK